MNSEYSNFFFDEDKSNFNLTIDSIPWFLVSAIKKFKKISYICSDIKELKTLKSKILAIDNKINIIDFPDLDCPLFSNISPSNEVRTTRIKTLTKLLNIDLGENIVLTTIESLLLKTIPKDVLINKYFELNPKNSKLTIEKIKEFLINNSYERVETVRQKGEFAIRGGILDIFSPSEDFPIRIDSFASTIDSLKNFDPITQLSLNNLKKSSLIPTSEIFLNKKNIEKFRINFRTLNIDNKKNYYNNISQGIRLPGIEQFLPFFYNSLESFFSYLVNYKLIVNFQFKDIIFNSYKRISSQLITENYTGENIHKFILNHNELCEDINSTNAIKISNFINYNNNSFITLSNEITEIKKINSENDINSLLNYLKSKLDKYFIIFAVKNNTSKDRILRILKNTDFKISKVKIKILKINIKKGFIHKNESSNGLIVINDDDLFGRKTLKYTKKNIDVENLISEISNLNQGDLVVHSEHGIGKYIGLKNVLLYEVNHECVELEYYNKDKLLIPVENLELLSRYGSKENLINLDRLGTQNWQLRKSLIKKKIKHIAFELVQTAAKRELRKGKTMLTNNSLYESFSSKFEYAETSDQLKAINDIENDLASGKSMDRLICGDVGYGKTEIAMRAAFIAASSGYQVAFLCPTTLLVNQHYKNFLDRFESFKINIKKLTRFQTLKEKKTIFDNIKSGDLKIIIGTHSLLNQELKFYNLGLIIIDEEQNFGVEQKEKLKKFKVDVHILTLTATPIPRTLQSSIVGIKDLSLIKTPPLDRLAIKNYLTVYNENTIKNAINLELDRNGQIFYVAPKIKDLEKIQSKIKKLVPKCIVNIVHGKLNGKDLNTIYNSFFEKKIDLLVSTSIIESGLDVSNANTIIIEKPNYFGLSQLYQIRGRIGRSNLQSYAYFVIPDSKKLSINAIKRLEVINNLNSLGGGFTLASHDMEIRGAGNLIGSEQSGHVREVGIELYQKLVRDAINEIRNESIIEDWSPQINLGFPVFIPTDYISDLQIRLNIYRRISSITDILKINEILNELRDRFGPVPRELINLVKIIEIKNLCKLCNINKISLGTKGFILTFRVSKESYDFSKLIKLVNKNPESLKLRPNNKLLYLIKSFDRDKKIYSIINFLKILSKK